YIALSYCWGNGNSVTTTASTIKQLKSGISRRMLPRTLQDAVEFTRELGIPYLWIDALCIIQDSASDWETESAKMGEIYNNAFLTVAASSAPSAGDGFLRRHQEPAELKVKWPDGVTARARIGPPGLLSPLDSEPWYQRGWTFQEQLLSARLVTYSDREVQWACPSVRACECGGSDGAKNLTPQTHDDHFPTALWQLADRAKAPDFWVNLVNSYSARSLTVERDRLPALSGIASRIGRLTESSYLAGLWAGDVLSGLCWSRRVPAAVGVSPGTYRAPTFSWASVDGPIHYCHRDRARDVKEPDLAPQSIDASTTVDGLNPFGVVTEGWIKVRAPIMSCTVQ
ncbi:heterokaryon incompatibility protein-domain-containing protein, partial [Lasiosphaeris hirsuta]